MSWLLALLALFSVVPVARAQALHEADLAGSALIFSKDGVFASCGYRIVGGSNDATAGGRRFVEAILVITRNGPTIRLKGSLLPNGSRHLKNLIPVENHGGWIKAPGKTPAAPLKDLPEGTATPPAGIHLVDPDGAVHVVDAIAKGVPIQIGVKWTPKVETIYFGKVTIKDAQVDQFYQCIAEVSADMHRPNGLAR
ncbi:MAG: hypothetical protein U1E02_16710 [Hydrogenophaga sp.]|nr:hypothetical protein [Hydrogenophaga sp.]